LVDLVDKENEIKQLFSKLKRKPPPKLILQTRSTSSLAMICLALFFTKEWNFDLVDISYVKRKPPYTDVPIKIICTSAERTYRQPKCCLEGPALKIFSSKFSRYTLYHLQNEKHLLEE
jgi:hypothetical protein